VCVCVCVCVCACVCVRVRMKSGVAEKPPAPATSRWHCRRESVARHVFLNAFIRGAGRVPRRLCACSMFRDFVKGAVLCCSTDVCC